MIQSSRSRIARVAAWLELRGEGFIGRHDEGRALGLLNDFRHGEGFTRSCDAEQDLVAVDRV